MGEQRKPAWLPALSAAALALALYAVTLAGTYVFDDRYIIQLDPRLGSPSQWAKLWTKDYFNGGVDNLYRPLVSMTFAVQTWLHGNGEDRAWIFHLVNWLLHAGVSALVAEFTRRISSSRIALIAGLLFAGHPIHVEAVANIVGRSELMCGLGIVAALTLAMRRPLTSARAAAIWGCFVFALLSKEQGMFIPAVLLLAWRLRRRAPADADSISPDERPGARMLILLLAWTLAGYIVFRETILKFWWDRSFLDWTINPLVHSEGYSRLLVPLALLGRYVALLIAPVHLSLDYGAAVIMPTISPHDPYLYIGVAAGVAWIVLSVVALVRRNWLIAFCLFSFAIFYGVISNVITLIGINFAERLMYIPSIFCLIMLAYALARFRRGLRITIVAALVALASLRTVTYAAQWNNRTTLFQTSLEREPLSIRLRLLLAEQLRDEKKYEQAESVLAEGREILPDYYRIWYDSAVLAFARGDIDNARYFIRRAERLRPSIQLSPLYRQLMQVQAAPATRPATRH